MIRKNTLALSLLAAFATTHAAGALADARVRVAHFAPFAAEAADRTVDVELDGATWLEDVEYGTVSEYVDVEAGTYDAEVTPVGGTDPALSGELTLEDGQDYTVAVIGNGEAQDLSLLVLEDDASAPAEGNARLRVVHAAPFASGEDAGPVSVRTDDGQVVGGMERLTYGNAGDAFEVPAGTYDLKISATGGRTNLIDAAPVELAAGTTTTIFAVGDDAAEPLSLYALPGGELELEMPADDRFSGHWYNPETPGQGFGIHPVPGEDRIFVTWYTFDDEGNPRWYAGDTCATPGSDVCDTVGFDGSRAVFAMWEVTGGRFDEAGEVENTPVGELTIDFEGCRRAAAVYDINDQEGSFDLWNLTPVVDCTDELP